MTSKDNTPARELTEAELAVLRDRLENPPTNWQRLRNGEAVVIFSPNLPFGRQLIFGRTGIRGVNLAWRLTWTRRWDFRSRKTGLFCEDTGSSASRNCGAELELQGFTHKSTGEPWVSLWWYCPRCRYRQMRPAELQYARATRGAVLRDC